MTSPTRRKVVLLLAYLIKGSKMAPPAQTHHAESQEIRQPWADCGQYVGTLHGSKGYTRPPHGIVSAHAICPSKPSSVARDFSRAPRTMLNGFAPGIQIVAKMRPRSRPVRACPGTDAPDGPPTIDAMPLQIHTQPDPDHFCETCGGPSELISQTITPWDGNETMACEVSP